MIILSAMEKRLASNEVDPNYKATEKSDQNLNSVQSILSAIFL